MLYALILLASAQSALPPADPTLSQTAPTNNSMLLEARVAELENELLVSNQQRDNARKLLADREAQISSLQNELANVRRELATARANVRSSSAASSDMESTLSNLQAEVEKQKAALATAIKKQATLEDNLQQTLAALAATQRELDSAQASSLSGKEIVIGLAVIAALFLISFLLGMYWQRQRVRNRLGGLEI